MHYKSASIEIPEDSIFRFDTLSRNKEIKILTEIILSVEDSLVISINAPWGMGKTTFFRLWQQYLNLIPGKQSKENSKVLSIYFNAWQTDYSSDPLLVLLSEIEKFMGEINGDTYPKGRTFSNIRELLPSVLLQGAKAGTKLLTYGILDYDKIQEAVIGDAASNIAVDVLGQFQKQESNIKKLRGYLKSLVKEFLPKRQPILPIFIDELDRCRPSYAIELLERVKHFFDIEKIVFILAINQTQLCNSIKGIYGNDFDSEIYIKKFIDFQYNLKTPPPRDFIESKLSHVKYRINHDYQTMSKSNGFINDCTDVIEFFLLCEIISFRDIVQIISKFQLILYSKEYPEPIISNVLLPLIIISFADSKSFIDFSKPNFNLQNYDSYLIKTKNNLKNLTNTRLKILIYTEALLLGNNSKALYERRNNLLDRSPIETGNNKHFIERMAFSDLQIFLEHSITEIFESLDLSNQIESSF